jgi:hypothetical protein
VHSLLSKIKKSEEVRHAMLDTMKQKEEKHILVKIEQEEKKKKDKIKEMIETQRKKHEEHIKKAKEDRDELLRIAKEKSNRTSPIPLFRQKQMDFEKYE